MSTSKISENFESNQDAHLRSKSLAFNTGRKQNGNNFNETLSKLQSINFNHHNSELCLCNDCSCGRHLCQLNCIKPDLSKTTTYKKDFISKKAVQNKINISSEYDRFKGPNL